MVFFSPSGVFQVYSYFSLLLALAAVTGEGFGGVVALVDEAR
jgi:hypothetical protein